MFRTSEHDSVPNSRRRQLPQSAVGTISRAQTRPGRHSVSRATETCQRLLGGASNPSPLTATSTTRLLLQLNATYHLLLPLPPLLHTRILLFVMTTARAKPSGLVPPPLPPGLVKSDASVSGGSAALHLSEAAAAAGPPSPLSVADHYGSLVDTLYRCLLVNETRDRQGREVLLLHKAHVASYRAAGLLGSPHALPQSRSAAAAAVDSVDRSVQRLTVQLEAASSTHSLHSDTDSPPHVDTGVFSDSDWSDDDSGGDSDFSPHDKATLALPHSVGHHHQHDGHEHHHDEHASSGRGPDMLLLERLLVLYVDVFCEQSEAFAPFAKRDRSVSEDAVLLYDHLTQKTQKASAFHSLARNLRWLTVKSHLIAFFKYELEGRRKPASAILAASAVNSSSSNAIKSSNAHATSPSKSRVYAKLSSFYHGVADKVTHTAPQPANKAPLPVARPATHGSADATDGHAVVAMAGPGAEYFRQFNVTCSELHALYAAASSTINTVLEARVLTPAAFEKYDRAEDLNAAVMEALRSEPVMDLIASYHAAYQRAVLTSPGYILLSRTMRHRIESDEAFLTPATFTDLIVAVHGVASLLIGAFQTLVAANAAASIQLMSSSDQLRAMRTVQQSTPINHEQQVESVSAWIYDSRVYPKPLTSETFALLAMVQVGDATVLREVAAERFEEAVARLRVLGAGDKAALLASLALQRLQQKEALMTREIANASRASHLGLSTASFSLRHTTSDSVNIELLRNDNDVDTPSGSASKSSSSTLEPISPSPSTAIAPHLQPKRGDSKKEEKSVKLEDILKWIDLSPQYVVGLGRDDEYAELRAFAVFDKTFTEPQFSNIKDILVTGLTTRQKIHSSHLLKEATHSSKTMADFVEAVLFSSATNSEAVQVGPDFFADPLIIWKEGKKPHDVHHIKQPLPFNDIDWLQMFVDSPALMGALHNLSDVSSLVDSDSDVRKPLSHAEFVAQTDKNGVLTGFVLPLHRSRTARPVKVVDLKYPNSSYVHSAARATYTNAIKGALSDSPIYGPTQAINAALERIFDFTDLLYLQKQAQALLLVAEAIDGHTRSPFAHSVFTRADLDAAIFYLLRSNIMLSAVFVNLFTHNDKLTANYLAHIHAKRDNSLEQLQKRKLTVLPLSHSFFALTILRDPHSGALTRLKLFVLGFTKLGRSAKPHCAVDFLRPTRETKKRLALQYILTGANFLYIPFPGANGLPKIIYKELVVREQNRRQMWEAGLLAHVQHNPGELTELFVQHLHISQQSAAQLEEQAVLILQDRKLSPLDFDVEEREQHRDVVEAWLERQDHDYVRIQPKAAKEQQPHKPGVMLDAAQMLRLASR